MPSPDVPTTYALEKAVRVATRKLGRSAAPEEIESEAFRILVSEGFSPLTPATDYSSSVRDVFSPDRSRMTGHSAALALDTPPRVLLNPTTAALHLSVSAAGCTSRRPPTQRARLYDALRKQLLLLPEKERKATFLHVRETSALFIGHHPEVTQTVAQTLCDVAHDMDVRFIYGPFIDVALPENLGLIERLPDMLNLSDRICPIVQLSTMDNGTPELAIEALSFALALVSSERVTRHPLILSVNDCDRRAFGHRVHPESIIVHRRSATHVQDAATYVADLPSGWHQVASADLPVLPDASPERTTDLVQHLSYGNPAAIKEMVERHSMGHATSSARRQLLLLC